jgi:hypothetical protein
MYGKTTFEQESPAELIGRYSTGFSNEVEVGWPCATAIQILESNCPDTPQVIIRDSNQEDRAFEIAFLMAENARIPFSSPMSAATEAEAI